MTFGLQGLHRLYVKSPSRQVIEVAEVSLKSGQVAKSFKFIKLIKSIKSFKSPNAYKYNMAPLC